MVEIDWLQQMTIWVLPVLFAITLHEAAHAYAAKKFGDSSAYMLGRMSLNPLKHIDLFGTILLPLMCIAFKFGFIFGWAKPVPINFDGLNNPKRDMRWVALAGPFANLVMAMMWLIILRLANMSEGFDLQYPLMLMAQAGVSINLLLMLLNLLPIPPLDGGRVVVSLLPDALAYKFSRIEPYGIYILIFLLFTGLLTRILQPLLAFFVQLLAWMF